MKVLFVCDDEKQAEFVRTYRAMIELAISGALFWPSGVYEFDIVPVKREPTPKELDDLMTALERDQ